MRRLKALLRVFLQAAEDDTRQLGVEAGELALELVESAMRPRSGAASERKLREARSAWKSCIC